MWRIGRHCFSSMIFTPLKQLNLKDGHFSLPVITVTQPTKMTVSRWKLSVELLECTLGLVYIHGCLGAIPFIVIHSKH